MKHQRKSFEGRIKYISVSPHGDPEGIVLDNGTFLKIPPHSVIKPELIHVGAPIAGDGELVGSKPNPVFHHVKILAGENILADDSTNQAGDKRESKAASFEMTGTLVAVSTKPKGEIDRLIFSDGTSVHVPKEIEVSKDDCELGRKVRITGQTRVFGANRFVKADSVRMV